MPTSSGRDYSTQAILVALDFEPAARAALLFSAQLAQLSGAPLKILHVVHEPSNRPNYYQRDGASDATTPMEELARQRISELVLDVYHNHPELQVLETPDTLFVSGLPATRIPEVARLIGAGQIVMGQDKPKGLFGQLLTSLSERVSKDCEIPVTIVGSSTLPGSVANLAVKAQAVPVDTGITAASRIS